MKKKLLLIGGGGHCKSVIDSVLASGEYDDIGIVDNVELPPYQGIDVVGTDDDLTALHENGWSYAFVTVGSVGDTRIRRKLYNTIKSIGFIIPVIVDNTAIIASDVVVSPGSYIGKRSVINSGSMIGICAIINTASVIEHECSVGDFAHISSGAVLCGQVIIGCDTHIGAGSVVRQQITIGTQSLIGAGSVVVQNIQDNVKAYGNPCKVVKA